MAQDANVRSLGRGIQDGPHHQMPPADAFEMASGLWVSGIGFRSVTEKSDTIAPGSKLDIHNIRALAEFDRVLVRERTRAVLATTQERGRKDGRP